MILQVFEFGCLQLPFAFLFDLLTFTLQAKKKYQEAAEMKNALQADNEELKLKYQQKAQ